MAYLNGYVAMAYLNGFVAMAYLNGYVAMASLQWFLRLLVASVDKQSYYFFLRTGYTGIHRSIAKDF